jgi:hypothetical protein
MWQVTVVEGTEVTRIVLGNEKCARTGLVRLQQLGYLVSLRKVDRIPPRSAAEAARVNVLAPMFLVNGCQQ